MAVQFRAYLENLFDLRYVVGVQAWEDGDDTLDSRNNFVTLSPTVYAFLFNRLKEDGAPESEFLLDFSKLKYVVKPKVCHVAATSEIDVQPVADLISGTSGELYVRDQCKNSALFRLARTTPLLLQLMLTFRHVYRYFKCFSILEAKGYKIDLENPEDSYLEIISQGDEKMIDVLADYLDAQEFMENVDELMYKLGDFEDRIKFANSTAEITRIYKDIIEKFGVPK